MRVSHTLMSLTIKDISFFNKDPYHYLAIKTSVNSSQPSRNVNKSRDQKVDLYCKISNHYLVVKFWEEILQPVNFLNRQVKELYLMFSAFVAQQLKNIMDLTETLVLWIAVLISIPIPMEILLVILLQDLWIKMLVRYFK